MSRRPLIIATKRKNITIDLQLAVSLFSPILHSLQVMNESHVGIPVPLSLFPHLSSYGPSNWSEKWMIVILRRKFTDPNSRSISMAQYRDGKMTYFIILHDELYANSRSAREMRKIVVVHEFCHFVAFAYACICSMTEEALLANLKERLPMAINKMTDKDIVKLYQFLSFIKVFDDDYSHFEQVTDNHFRLGYEDLGFDYGDLFKNFIMPFQMFDSYFSHENKDKFIKLYRSDGKVNEALSLYIGIVIEIAKKEWLPEKFALNRALFFLREYYIKELLKDGDANQQQRQQWWGNENNQNVADFLDNDWLAEDSGADFEKLISYFMEDYRLAQKFEKLYMESKL